MGYDEPRVRDFGTVAELTKAIGIIGGEDGASKAVVQHHNLLPSPPALPSIPLLP